MPALAHLKQLDINGFKSFANPTTFVFDRGVTAIIGPNGSGKSNVAEALRWVLGEQQYSNLRSRRTEDIIFGGSDRRGRMGLAEVSLTIDNSSGLLPIEFNEVNVTRRAHRSGENQYLINGNRVRLRDIQQLTAPLGQAHTIVGQGLVDAVLSQRPDDRRSLFEHAAGITGLRMQTVRAERGLAEAEENAQRLQDITGELEPRVRSLARRARQAQQYESVRAELSELQRGYYGALWITARERHEAANIRHAAAAATVEQLERDHTSIRTTLTEARAAERKLASERAAQAERLSTLETDLAAARHRLELLQAESRAAEERARERARAREQFEAAQAERKEALAATEQRIAALGDEVATNRASYDAHITERDQVLEQRSTLETELAQQESANGQRVRRLNQIDIDLAGARERATILERTATELETRLASLKEQLGELGRETDRADEEIAEAAAEVESVRQQRDELERTLDQLEGELRRAQALRQESERDLDRLRGRHELLERIWAEGEGLHAGVRAVLRAARGNELNLPGLVGTVAEVVSVPAEYETAIETALGGHLQDIIVRHWDDAATGVDYLKSTGSGRARFQPLDTLRRYRPRQLTATPAGLIDRAAALVEYDPEISVVIDQLLGRTLVARDLDAAHALSRELDGWTIVTLQGELVAPSGSVTGGSRMRGAGLLARERERRGLPARIEAAERQLEDARESIRTLQRRQEREVDSLQSLDSELADARTRERAATERRRQHRRELEAETATVTRQQQELGRLRDDLATLASTSEPLSQERAAIEAETREFEAQREQLKQQLNDMPIPDERGLGQLSTELATLEERLRSAKRERDSLAAQIDRAVDESARHEAEIANIAARRSELGRDAAELQETVASLTATLAEERGGMGPITARLAELRDEITAQESQIEERGRELREAERRLDQAALDVARAGDAVDLLRNRILDDLDIDDPAGLVACASDASEETEQAIRRLRERLRRMGSAGEDVIEEHREESERLEYLTSQLSDVEGATESLRQVLRDLHQQMGNRFGDTFDEVAKEFEATFKRLFGGGSARLSHEPDGDEPGGIDIVVRPPGKRLQGLNQLSGGERALTAVALLIAIQRVNPSPFCMLDEVDAALDESNVIRFRQELRDLAQDTQYIVITHNRGTIEGADTLYGITMGDDSVSRVLSLRLDEAIRAIEDDQLLEMESVI